MNTEKFTYTIRAKKTESMTIEIVKGENEEEIIREEMISQLEQKLEALEAELAAWEEKEPEDMMSDEYDAWDEARDELELKIDETEDRLEELREA